VFDGLTFRMRREENKKEKKELDKGEHDGDEEEELIERGGVGDDGSSSSGDGGGFGGNDDAGAAVGEQWSDALRLMLSHSYSIHGDRYDPYLVPLLWEWLLTEKDRDKGLQQDKDQDKEYNNDKGKDNNNNNDKGLSRRIKGQGLMRLYSCQQSLMKMHPLFDYAIVKVTFIPSHMSNMSVSL